MGFFLNFYGGIKLASDSCGSGALIFFKVLDHSGHDPLILLKRLSDVKTAYLEMLKQPHLFYNNIFNIDLYSIYDLFLHASQVSIRPSTSSNGIIFVYIIIYTLINRVLRGIYFGSYFSITGLPGI
jgi:hypothetical protein